MQATKFGLNAGKLFLLSCLFHVHNYMPDFLYGGRCLDSRHLDLVILAIAVDSCSDIPRSRRMFCRYGSIMAQVTTRRFGSSTMSPRYSRTPGVLNPD